ncbi:MAG: HTH domain-containing protein [Patescibacteria group bacterium]
MDQLILITIIIILVAAVLWIAMSRKMQNRVVNIYTTTFEQTARKEEYKKKALDFIISKGEAGNDEIKDRLGVSRRSVVRYLDELEKEEAIEQVGDVGRGVIYRAK